MTQQRLPQPSVRRTPQPLACDCPTNPPKGFTPCTVAVSEAERVQNAIAYVNSARGRLLTATRAWLDAHAEWRDLELERTRRSLRGLGTRDVATAVAEVLERLENLSKRCDVLKATLELAEGARRRAARAPHATPPRPVEPAQPMPAAARSGVRGVFSNKVAVGQ